MAQARRFLGSVVALLGVMALAAPASATVLDRGTFTDSQTGLEEEICGIDVLHDFTFTDRFRVRVDKKSGGQAFFGHDIIDFVDTFTNPETGAFITISGHEVFNEIKARQISGNVYEFTAVEAGQPFILRDSEGNVVMRDRGAIRWRSVFDTLGDSQPGGIELSSEVVRVSGPHPGFDQPEGEFCAIVVPLLT